MDDLTVRQAEELLTEWKTMNDDRDTRVLAAVAARVPKTRIAELTGLDRSTVYRIIGEGE